MNRSSSSREAGATFPFLGKTKEKGRAFVHLIIYVIHSFLEISEEGTTHSQIHAVPKALDHCCPWTYWGADGVCVCVWYTVITTTTANLRAAVTLVTASPAHPPPQAPRGFNWMGEMPTAGGCTVPSVPHAAFPRGDLLGAFLPGSSYDEPHKQM